MSTMYYTANEDKIPIAQTHALPNRQGYHITWTMYPDDFANFVFRTLTHEAIISEYGDIYSVDMFMAMVSLAISRSFEEGIA